MPAHSSSALGRRVALGFFLQLLAPAIALATEPCQDQPDPTRWASDGNLISATIAQEQRPFALADPAGGVTVLWLDRADPPSDRIKSHRFDSDGNAWPATSREVSLSSGQQSDLDVITAAEASILSVWRETESGASEGDIRVQRTTHYGRRWDSFIPEGISVCSASGDQRSPSIATGGSEDFYVAWSDHRSEATTGADIYIQRFHDHGQVWEGWPVDGVAVCSSPGNQIDPAVVNDGAGGAFVVFVDDRAVMDHDIYVKRITAEGTVPAGWESEKPVADGPLAQTLFATIGDGAGGLFVAWREAPDQVTSFYHRVRLKRLTAAGEPALGWPTEGESVSNPAQSVSAPVLVSDGAGGVYVAWTEVEAKLVSRARVTRIRHDGSPAAGWAPGGLSLGPALGSASPVSLMADSTGVFTSWSGADYSMLVSDVRVLKLDPTGLPAKHWPYGGRAVEDAPEVQTVPDWRPAETNGGAIAPDGAGGAFLVWKDHRAPPEAAYYAHRVGANGSVPPQSWSGGVPCDGKRRWITRLYPQPARATLSLDAFAPNDRPVVLDVYDVHGRLVRTERLASVPGPGIVTIRVDTSTLRPGIHFLRYREEGPGLTPRGSTRFAVVR